MLNRAVRRLTRELEIIRRDYAQQFTVRVPDEEELKWVVDFEGPPGSVYEGERFTLKFEFDENYVSFTQPIEAPEVVFVGKPPVHEHVYSNGFICLSVLYNGEA